METSSLVGKTLNAVFTFAFGPVHPAWVNELTTPIVSWAAFLQLEGIGFVHIDACEVYLESEKYPVLGLSFQSCAEGALQVSRTDGSTTLAQLLPEVAALLPARVLSASESDPLGQGTMSQCVLALEGGGTICFRHIFPPETLGICVEKPEVGT